ncbi:hypothetical protein Salat_2964900 [Sesamum alatum]|uniref:Uncharacterized protein n=1 Tax=Sesamum alatum TaxID=300844 RepID=A0AAE1XHS1_9LAMI|nr:hypothetical protein Salat_2971300 [Sesamum alatum]KAK4412236.1 hypothetical protein Salat_2964900 [Sesamum alatum]
MAFPVVLGVTKTRTPVTAYAGYRLRLYSSFVRDHSPIESDSGTGIAFSIHWYSSFRWPAFCTYFIAFFDAISRFHLPLLIPLPGLLLKAPLYDGISPGVEEYGKVSRPTIDGKLEAS